MEDKIKERLESLRNQKESLMANLNAVSGAIVALEDLLKQEDSEENK